METRKRQIGAMGVLRECPYTIEFVLAPQLEETGPAVDIKKYNVMETRGSYLVK